MFPIHMKADVCFVGLGYIGLPTAILFANSGLDVVGFDADLFKVSRINSGEWESREPGLLETLESARHSGHFAASTEPVPAHVYVIAVPTPLTDTKKTDLSFVLDAGKTIASVLSPGDLVILESTVPPGTTEKLAQIIYSCRPELANSQPSEGGLEDGTVLFAHCPERILPGNAFQELRANDRVVGGLTAEAAEKAAELYKTFCTGQLHLTTAATAEMTKLAENSFRDVNIAFANELSLIATDLGVNPWEVIELANHHPRVNILKPGPGVGGHCIAVDPWFLAESSPDFSNLIRTARSVNDYKPAWVVDQANSVLETSAPGAVAILGLTFKPNIDDLRESPSLQIAAELMRSRDNVRFFLVEPNIKELPEGLRFPNAELVRAVPAPEFLKLVLYLVDHDEFKQVDWSAYESIDLIDARGPLSHAAGKKR